jgi:hypothetical protein
MSDFANMGCYTGMRLRVALDRSVSWQPNKFAGNHGARFLVIDNDGLVDMVLAKRSKGSWVKVTRDSEVLCFEQGKPVLIGTISSPPKLEFEKLKADPQDLMPGMIWSGPFDGEYHHFCENRFWVSNIQTKRCHYQPPSGLRRALERFKPLGGSFVVTPWKHVIGLIEPQPLPEESRDQWEKLSKEERRLLQLKMKGANMLPIYICKWDDEWEIELDEPVDYSKPLSKEEIDNMVGFLTQFSSESKKPLKSDEEDGDSDAGVQEEWADDADFFEEDALNLMYSPSDD